jgi:hypothetical protein
VRLSSHWFRRIIIISIEPGTSSPDIYCRERHIDAAARLILLFISVSHLEA